MVLYSLKKRIEGMFVLLLYTADALTLSYAIKLENKTKTVLGAFVTVYVWQDYKRRSCRVQCALPDFFFSQFGKS